MSLWTQLESHIWQQPKLPDCGQRSKAGPQEPLHHLMPAERECWCRSGPGSSVARPAVTGQRLRNGVIRERSGHPLRCTCPGSLQASPEWCTFGYSSSLLALRVPGAICFTLSHPLASELAAPPIPAAHSSLPSTLPVHPFYHEQGPWPAPPSRQAERLPLPVSGCYPTLAEHQRSIQNARGCSTLR